MADWDTVAKYRRNIATRLEWSLRTNKPEQRLRDATKSLNGRTLLRNVPAASQPSPLSQPRVLREAASELAELEEAAGATYPDMLAMLKGRYGRTVLGDVFPSTQLGDDWASVPKSDAQPALAAFHDACTTLALKKRLRKSAANVHNFLTSATGRQLSDLSHLQDVDLEDWRLDHGVLRNVLQGLGNPAEWIETWLDAGTPSNVVSRRNYVNFYSVFALNAVVAKRKFRRNLWATRKQWERMECQILDGERGAPVFHYFSPPSGEEEHDVTGAVKTFQGPLRRVSFVFNVAQVRSVGGRPFRLPKLVEKRADVDECVSRHDVRLYHKEVESPSYDPEKDEIVMPPRTWFRSPAGRDQATLDYYATLLHELVHWTGHESRLARPFAYTIDEKYRFEELVAELGSGFLCVRFGLGNARRLTAGRHGVAAYINQYLEQGCDSIDLVIDAAGEANRASNYLIYAKTGEP